MMLSKWTVDLCTIISTLWKDNNGNYHYHKLPAIFTGQSFSLTDAKLAAELYEVRSGI